MKTNKDCSNTYREKKGDEYKIKDAIRKRSEREKKEVFRPTGARCIQEKRGSTDKRISIEEEVGRTVFL